MKNRLLLGSALLVLTAALGGCASSGNSSNSSDFIVQSLAKAGKGWSTLPDYDRGKHYLLAGDYGLAIEAFGAELARDPGSVRALNGAAIAYQRIGRSDVAEKLFAKALKLDPDSTLTLNNLAFLHLTRGDRAGALALVERAKAAPAGNAAVARVLAGNEALLGVAVPKPFGEAAAVKSPPAAPVVPVITKPLATLAAESAAGPAPVPKTAPQMAEATPAPFVPAPEVPPSIYIPSPKPTVRTLRIAPPVILPPPAAVATATPATPATPHAEADVVPAQTHPALTARVPVRFAALTGPALQAAFEMPVTASASGRDGVQIPAAGKSLGTLSVVNGSGRDHMARRIGQYLTGKGFHVGRLANAKSFGRRRSLLFCHPASQQGAELIARAMPVPVQVVVMKSASDRIELIAGSDLDAFDEHLASLRMAQR